MCHDNKRYSNRPLFRRKQDGSATALAVRNEKSITIIPGNKLIDNTRRRFYKLSKILESALLLEAKKPFLRDS